MSEPFGNSNTSHVIVYHVSCKSTVLRRVFKYISCYCLSVHPSGEGESRIAFKYISCYCLSVKRDFVFVFESLFKYISCYCLSRRLSSAKTIRYDSNTSHVIVYREPLHYHCASVWIQIHLMLLFIGVQKFRLYVTHLIQIHLMLLFIHDSIGDLFFEIYSNTSHVIVYLSREETSCPGERIQIHLMLLFIPFPM